jgi:hypothetical protein
VVVVVVVVLRRTEREGDEVDEGRGGRAREEKSGRRRLSILILSRATLHLAPYHLPTLLYNLTPYNLTTLTTARRTHPTV